MLMGERVCELRLQVYSLSIDSWVWREHTSAVDGDVPSPR